MATGSRKKLEGNGIWESSRMMLPEHKVALNVWDRDRISERGSILISKSGKTFH